MRLLLIIKVELAFYAGCLCYWLQAQDTKDGSLHSRIDYWLANQYEYWMNISCSSDAKHKLNRWKPAPDKG